MKLQTAIFLIAPLIFISHPVQSKVVINELMYRPSSLLVDDEFIELFNYSENDADISNWKFDKGVSYVFPPGAMIKAGSYLVLSASPDVFKKHYSDQAVYGPYDGRLSNDGENVELVDESGARVDFVSYIDEAGWPPEADGRGPSIERIHPEMESTNYASWRKGPIGGTPGKQNSSALPNPIPIVTDIRQYPIVPTNVDAVQLNCRIIHSRSISQVELLYKTEQDVSFKVAAMYDDGKHSDLSAGDGIYGGEIPPFIDGSVVEFFLQAIDDNSQTGEFPITGMAPPAIYRVDNKQYDTVLPLYRVMMRDKDERTLRTRSAASNDELFASFIYGNDIFYNVGFRFRGKGSRGAEPKSYRVNFSKTRYFQNIRKLNLNAQNTHRQYVGMEVFKTLNMYAPLAQFVAVNVNKSFVPNYIQMERTDKDMMIRIFGDESGNLYRGIEQGNFDYRGEDVNRYQPNYQKITNELENDYSDIVRLCEAFSLSSDGEFVSQMQKNIDIHQWIRWFAVKKILNDTEGGLSKERGDDYYIYHNPQDDLFYLLPWDLDSVLTRPVLKLFEYGTPAVLRLLQHPDLAPIYYQELVNILENELSQEIMDAIIDRTEVVANVTTRNDMKQISREIRASILSDIPRSLSVETTQSINAILVSESDVWRFYRGKAPIASNWYNPDFNDSAWESGPAGFGYGDNDDRTVLNDMQNQYSTVYIRKTFNIDDPSVFGRLSLSVLYDDAFIIYLNGVEILRRNFNGNPVYNSFSNASHEAQGMEQFWIENASSLLVSGENTIAAIGLNVNLPSTDFSLAIQMEGTVKSSNIVELKGRSDAVRTRWIRVNGELANYTPWKAEWNYFLPITNQPKVYKIEALAADSSIIEATDVILGNNNPGDGGDIVTNGTWTEQQSPIVIDNNIIIQKSDSLVIDPGVVVQLAPNASIIVYGRIIANGQEGKTIQLLPKTGESAWGGVVIDNASGAAQFHYTNFIRSKPFSFQGKNYPATVNIDNSVVDMHYCRFQDINPGGTGAGIDANQSSITINSCYFYSMGEGIHGANTYADIENNYFEKSKGSNDPIDLNGESRAPSIIRENTFLGSEDDCIDFGGTSALIEGNWIQDCADKGISLEGESEVKIVNNVFLRADIAVAVTDKSHAALLHNTILSCNYGVSIYEKTANQGGGMAEITNCVIWEANQSIEVDDKSYLMLAYCDLMQLPEQFREENISQDPMLTINNIGIVTMPADSPIIDAGIKTDVLVDILGNSRNQGKAPDIGAYEYMQPVRINDWKFY